MTRLLGPEPYGTIALVGTVVNLGGVLALFGRETGYTRVGLQGEDEDRQRVETYLWQSVLLSALGVSILFSVVWVFIAPSMIAGAESLAIFLGFALLLSPLVAMATVRRRLNGQYAQVALASILSSVGGIAASISWALFVSRDAWALAIGLIATAALNLMLLGIPALQSFFKRSDLESSIKRAALHLGIPSVITAPIYWAMMSLDRWVIQSNGGAAEVGIYSYAAQFGLLGAMINNALIMTWLPETSRIYDAKLASALPAIGQNFTRLFAGILVVWLGVSASGTDLIRLLSPEEFHRGAEFVPWIAAGVMFYGVSSLFVASLFIRKRMRHMVVAWVIGGTTALLLYVNLAPHLGALGVAIGQSAGFLAIALVTWIASLRTLALPIPYARIGVGFICTVVLVCLMSPAWSEQPALSLVLKLPFGILAAISLGTVLSPDLVGRGLRELSSRQSKTKAE